MPTLAELEATIDAWEDGLLGVNSRDDARLRAVVDAPEDLIAQLDDYRRPNAEAIRASYGRI